MADRREELLKGLLHLGCVEISEPGEVLADPQWASLFQRSGSSLAERKGQLTDVNTALDAIKQYAKLKDGMFIETPSHHGSGIPGCRRCGKGSGSL